MWIIFSQLVLFIISIADTYKYELSHVSYEYNEVRKCLIERIHHYHKKDNRLFITLYENLDGSGHNFTDSIRDDIPNLENYLQNRKFGNAKLLCLNSLWLMYPNERYNQDSSGPVWIVTGFHCFNLEKSKIRSIQRFAEHPQWLPEEITFFQEPLFQGRMRKFGKHDGWKYHSYEENEATCGIYKSAIITGSTSWLVPLRKPEEPKQSGPTQYCFNPSPSGKDVEYVLKKNCTQELNRKEDREYPRFCGRRPPTIPRKDSGESSSPSDHNSYNDDSNELFFAYPYFPNSVFKDLFPLEQDVEQTETDYDNGIPYESEESSSEEMTMSRSKRKKVVSSLSAKKVKAIETPVITIHDKPDLGKLFICILEDMTLVSAPSGMIWDGDDGEAAKECETVECNNLHKLTQLNITNCFRYGLAFQIQNMHSRKPNFCSYHGGGKALNNLNSTDSQKGHGNSDEKASPLHAHAAWDRKSYTKVLRLLQQKIEFDSQESLSGSDNKRVHTKLNADDIDKRKQNDSKESSNRWEDEQSLLLDVLLDIVKKKCDERWLPQDFLKFLKKLSLFFIGEVGMSQRDRKERITRKQMQTKMKSNNSETNNMTANDVTTGGAGDSEEKAKMTEKVMEKVHAAEGKPSMRRTPYWNEIKKMLQDCLHEVNKSNEPLTLIPAWGEPNLPKYYQKDKKAGGQRRNFEASFLLISYAETVDEMLSQQLDPILEFLWQTYSLVYASCISKNKFNTELLVFAKFSAWFEKFFLSPVVTFCVHIHRKTVDSDLSSKSKYHDSIYNHLFFGYNYILMVHNAKACAQALFIQQNLKPLIKPTGIF